MKKLNNVLIFLCSLAAICIFVKDINIGASDRLLGDITIPLVLFMPRIIRKIFKIKITYAMELVYVIFIILAQFIGSVINLYNKVWWYDLFAHFLSGVLTTILAMVVMDWFGVYNEKHKWFNVLFMICFTLTIASLWEFTEFATDLIMKTDVQHVIDSGVADTMEDMLIAFVGSIIVSISYLVENKVSKNGFLRKIVSDLK